MSNDNEDIGAYLKFERTQLDLDCESWARRSRLGGEGLRCRQVVCTLAPWEQSSSPSVRERSVQPILLATM